MLSPAVENLVTQLTKLPGIGRRTAQRLTFHLLSARPEDALELARAIEDVKSRVRFCRECGNLTEEELCVVCSDPRRDRAVICVVEQPVDVVSLERTGEYRGLYHVLGGALSPLDGVEPADLRLDALFGRVQRDGVTEVVLATNPTMTGEATAAYIADRLRGRVQVTRLASGLPVGGDLEYRGLYHVLGGALSPLDGVEPADLRLDALFGRVQQDGVTEVVLATNPTMTGEATAAYIADRLRGRVQVTRLASGLPVGGDLEYADEVTLGRALAGRREM